MTVKELIEELQKMPQDSEILCEGYSTSFTPVEVTNPIWFPSKTILCGED